MVEAKVSDSISDIIFLESVAILRKCDCGLSIQAFQLEREGHGSQDRRCVREQAGTSTQFDHCKHPHFPHWLFLPQDQASSSAQPHKFNFDHIFDMNSTQKEVYDSAAKPIIDSVLEGFNGTIFAYG